MRWLLVVLLVLPLPARAAGDNAPDWYYPDRLFPDGVVDRTDLRIASNNSACDGDVAALQGHGAAPGQRLQERSGGALNHD